jgi:hypothetical protein
MVGMRTIHRRITEKLEQIAAPSIVVGCGRCVSLAELAAGDLAHLDITYADGQLTLPNGPIIPPASTGTISTENVNGREITHRDQAKIPKDIYCGDRPNFGDWSNGSFSLWQTRKVYPRSFIPPRGVSIAVSDQGLLESGGCWRLAFKLEPPLVRAEAAFEGDLLFFLSLAKEAIGCFDVYSSEVSPDDIIATRRLQWEIFPPGQRGFREELERRLSRSDEETRERLLARADVITALNPAQWAVGSGFNSNYYGAILADDLVIFENLNYGNATYVLRDDWVRLSQLSRTELLGSSTDFDRLIHDATWEERLTRLIARERQKRRRRR